MKKIIVYAMSFFLIGSSFCQQSNSSKPVTRQDYLKKSKHQKTAAWILLGTGTISALLGTINTNPNSIVGGDDSRGTVFMVTGLAAIGVSIPFFITSGRNKRKAMNISTYFEIRQNSIPRQPELVYRSSPTLSIKINF